MIGLDPSVLDCGTTLVPTQPLETLLLMAPIVFQSRYIIAIDGPAGCGKTTAVTALVQDTSLPVTSVSLDPRSSDKDVVKLLYTAVTGRSADGRMLRTEMLADLRTVLAGKDRLVVVDEAQHAGIAALEMIRTLHMDPTATWHLVLSGAGLEKHLTAERMLKSRVMHWAVFNPINTDDIADVLTQMHPVFGEIDARHLEAGDRIACRGVLREWVKTLRVMLALTDRGATPDRALLEQALTATTGRQMRLPR